MNTGPSTFFEGTEKKVELVIDSCQPSFRRRGRPYWVEICRRARAEVLSEISNEFCDAYLLSESSLFVYDHKVIMITCGRTSLDGAILRLLKDTPAERIRMLIYERKNEVFPHSQPTSFFDDVAALSRLLPGTSYQLGQEDEHHLLLFHLDREYESDPQDTTLELLMYGLDETVRPRFHGNNGAGTAAVRQATGLHRVLPGYEIDDHLFEPAGYSLNALRGEEYFTFHVTPDETSSYASFETNARSGVDRSALVHRVLGVFQPRSFDLVLFQQPEPVEFEAAGYRQRSHVAQDLECGYQVRFIHYYRPQDRVQGAIRLPVGCNPSPRT